ncbi:MAG TPA: prepilin peptidase, partial [Patescibacteria group bacterium]|nr:prepilin peptidase [Patescibacteria group bacterium]
MLFILVSLFILGLLVGSFLNVVICRIDTGEGFLLSHSHCPHCGHRLAWYDLIPLVSFVLLRARCRYCKKNISYQYPLVEAVTGILFIFSFLSVFDEFHLFLVSDIENSLLP